MRNLLSLVLLVCVVACVAPDASDEDYQTTESSAALLGPFNNGTSCQLSANWKVAVSAQWDNRTNDTLSGFLNYVVINSDGHLGQIGIDILSTTGAVLHHWGPTPATVANSGGQFINRVDPDQGGANGVLFHVVAPSNIGCYIRVHSNGYTCAGPTPTTVCVTIP